MLKELKIYPSLATTQSVVWERDDAPNVPCSGSKGAALVACKKAGWRP
jgi:hypothetical protein